MNKLGKLKKILISLIIITIALLTKSAAVNGVYFSGYDALRTSKTYYCIEHQDGFDGGTWNPSSTTTIRSDDSSQFKRALAHILYKGVTSGNGGYNNHSKYQIAVWKWYYKSGVNTRWPSEYSDGGLYNEAMSVESVPYSNESAAIESSSTKITMTGLIGTFKFTKLGGHVTKVVVEWEDPADNNKTYSKTISAGNSKVDEWIGFYSDSKCTKELKIDDFSTKTFYLKNFKENYQVKSVTIHTEARASGYSVAVTRWKKSTGAISQQDLISANVTEGQNKKEHKTFTVKYSYGKIKLVKQGVYKEDGEQKTETIPASFKLYCTTLGKWVSGENTGNKTYVNDINEASIYKSGTTVSKLFSTYKYEVVEVAVENNYYNNPIKMVSAKSNLQSTLQITERNSYNAASGVIVYDGKTNKVTIKNERTSGDIIIYKVDYTYNQIVLQGAKIKVYVKDTGWLIKNADGTYSYDGTESTATEFETDSNGELKIDCVKFGTYYVYETKTPEGYDITKQDGYMNKNGQDPYSYSTNNQWAYLGYVELGAEDNTVKFTAKNKKIIDELEGYVWIDKPDTKNNSRDNIYVSNSKDTLKQGITVNLYDAQNTIIATTITDSNGHYKFTIKNASSYTGEDKNIYYWELAKCYVEFIYNNRNNYDENGHITEYGYIVVNPFTGTNASVNSKAQEYTMTTDRLDDNNLTGTTGENPGRAVTYKSTQTLSENELLERTKNISEKIKNNNASYDDLKQSPLTDYYNNQTYKISNINLGLIEQKDTEFDINETLAYIKVKMKGYTYIYKYGDAAVVNSTNVPTVNEQNSKKTFTGKIYPTDIAYNMAEAQEELQVYVVYSIGIKNTETTNVDFEYVEEKMYVESLENSYDTNRYVLCTNENNDDKSDFALWTDQGNGIAKYDINNNNSVYKNGILSQETKTSYIQFKIKESALEKILTGGLTYEDIENAPTVAKARAYHEYLRVDNVWVHDENVSRYEGSNGTIQQNTSGHPERRYYLHRTISKTLLSGDLYLKLSLGDPRTISGTVFEDVRTDESTSNNTNLGNGILDDNENNRAKEVTVELLNADKTTVTKLYKENNGHIVYGENGELPDAITKTVTGGTFTFEGIVPGYYYIRFTYGDGTQKMMPADSVIKSNDYKSTIINTANDGAGNIIKNAMEATSEQLTGAQQTLLADRSNESAKKLLEWYKYLDKKYSTAVDDINQRLAIEKYVYKEDGKVYDEAGNVVTNYPTNVNSYTPMTGISIENDIKDYTDNGNYHSPKYDEFNFGIIKESDVILTIDKKMTNVSFTTQTGSTLVSANPKDRTASYVTALDNIRGGSKYAKLELDPKQIYGSELKTTYEIIIENKTDKDYIEDAGSREFGYYHKYGEKTRTAKLKEVTVKEVIDKLDIKYNYDSILEEVEENVTHENGREEKGVVKIGKNKENEIITNPDGSTTVVTNENLSMTNWSGIESQAKTSIQYTVTSLLASEENDTSYKNEARITSIQLDKIMNLNSNFEWGTKLTDSTTLTITPTTGSDRSNTYWIAGVIALVAIATGFIFIKKRILK